jgi:renalase
MSTSLASADCLIVGAGLAGLCAAHTLAVAGLQAILLDKGHAPGGRLATRALPSQLGTATIDEGAQYFTVRETAFGAQVETWLAAGVAREWSRGFVAPDGSAFPDGHPRYCGAKGMAAMARHLAAELDVRLGSEVAEVAYDGAWSVTLNSGAQLQARALLLTPPVPQSLALLERSGIPLPAGEAALLARIDYDPCLALSAVLAETSGLPAPGGLWPGGETIYWIADNQQKGISALPALTIHATPEYSRSQFDGDAERIIAALLAAAAPWLESEVTATYLRRWRYSIPLQLYPARTLLLRTPGPLAFAGDAFAGPRVEGAALSGMAAGQALAAALAR